MRYSAHTTGHIPTGSLTARRPDLNQKSLFLPTSLEPPDTSHPARPRIFPTAQRLPGGGRAQHGGGGTRGPAVRGPEATRARASPPRAIQEQCLTQPVGIIPRAAVKPYASAVPRPTVQANAHSRCVWVISVRSDAESGCITGVISITDHSSFCLSEK